MSDFRNGAGGGSATAALHALAVRAFAASPRLALKVQNAGEIANYVRWQRDTFGEVRRYRSREGLWAAMASRMTGDWHGAEFGVAWGYATDWWLRRCPQITRWDGFDRFTGLPRAWRDHDAGTFGADGQPPGITDPRVTWHVGDVEETIGAFAPSATGARVVLFDLDLYEPSLAAWRHVAPHLRAGDLLYFDEAMDADERRLLIEDVLPAREYEVVGSTSLALGLRVT